MVLYYIHNLASSANISMLTFRNIKKAAWITLSWCKHHHFRDMHLCNSGMIMYCFVHFTKLLWRQFLTSLLLMQNYWYMIFLFNLWHVWWTAAALKAMYSGLGSPAQLTQWSSTGDDPCGQSWKGVTCAGTRVTEMWLSIPPFIPNTFCP